MRCEIRRRDHRDAAEAAFLAEQRLRGRHVEHGDRGAPQGDGGHLHEPADRVPDGWASVALGLDRVADRVVLGGGGGRTDRDLIRAAGPGAGSQGERVEALVAWVDAEAELGCSVGIDGFAVRADELDRCEQEATGGGFDTGNGLDPCQQ